MRTREPTPDHSHSDHHPEQEPLGQLPDSKHDLWTGPSLTIAEAARLCGVSASTIRRHLAAGRFPTAHQQPSPIPGQRGLWRIPAQDLLAAGLRARQARLPTNNRGTSPRITERRAGLVMTGFETSSTPWSWSVPVAEPPRTWPPSGPTRSRPWKAPCGRCKRSTLPRRPTPTALLPPQPHHPTPPTQPGEPPSQACCRCCRRAGRPSAPQPGGEGSDHRAGADRATATKAALVLTAQSSEGHSTATSRGGRGPCRACQAVARPSEVNERRQRTANAETSTCRPTAV
jgi:helix-turn-helix protein